MNYVRTPLNYFALALTQNLVVQKLRQVVQGGPKVFKGRPELRKAALELRNCTGLPLKYERLLLNYQSLRPPAGGDTYIYIHTCIHIHIYNIIYVYI